MSEMGFDGKSTLSCWGLELLECFVSSPQRKTHWVDIPAGNGKIDAMRGLGDPVYEMRTLTAKFKVLRGKRNEIVNRLLNELEGREMPIVPPDDWNHYWTGEVHVKGAGNSAGDEITIEATIYPWKYSRRETVHKIPASDDVISHVWYNGGSRSVVPELLVADSPVTISCRDFSATLPQGTYNLSEFKIPGRNSITVQISGGSLTARYREAIL